MHRHNKSQPAFLPPASLVVPTHRPSHPTRAHSSQPPMVCVSRPETSENVVTATIAVVVNLFRASSRSKLSASETHSLPDAGSENNAPSEKVNAQTPYKGTGKNTGDKSNSPQPQLRGKSGKERETIRVTPRLTRRPRAKPPTPPRRSTSPMSPTPPTRPTRALPTRIQKRRRSSAFPFFSRPSDRPSYPSALSQLSNARIVYFMENAFQRRLVSPPNPHLVTLLPYDIQRALFDDLTGRPSQLPGLSPSSPQRGSDPPFPAKSKAGENDKADNTSMWHGTIRFATDVFRFVTFQPGRTENNPNDNIATPSNSETAVAYTAAAMASEATVGFEAGSQNSLAAAAYAAATAIATSTVSTLDPLELAGLKAAVTAARAVANAEDAATFVNTVGLAALITAADSLPGTERAAALTALANIAIVLPKVRVGMLTKKSGQIVDVIVDIIYRSKRFHIGQNVGGAGLWYTEALVSGTHLLGSLALAKGRIGTEFRKKMAKDADLVHRLEGLAGGMKNGEAEGAARAARRALGVLGINQWKPRVPGQKGLRILSIDGGGTRAILAFETLKQLKKMTGCEIHELFDIIGGTSTGAIVAASIGLGHKSVEEVELLYRDMIGKVFQRHPVNGPKMLLTRAYYDTKVLETTLQRECGRGVFIDSLADDNMNRVFVVSSVMSRDPKELFVFRNYTYPIGYESRYDGTAEAQLWEGLRASSAAPTFFSEIRINGELHADGAIVANNPTAVALHETKCMFPGVPIELLVSLGNGVSPAQEIHPAGSEEEEEKAKKNMGWGDVVGSIVASATSTETVHHAMQDLFPEDKYFRFNPVTDSTTIDEISPETLAMFVKEAQEYIQQNLDKFDKVARILRPKTPQSLWRRFCDALRKEMRELESSAWDDDLYLPK